MLVVYINDALALNCRMYNNVRVAQLGLFVSEGGAAFDDVTMRDASASIS